MRDTREVAEEIRVGELTIRFLVEGAELGGAAAVFEAIVPPQARVPAPHSHDGYEETIYGVEGVMTFTVDGERREIGPGDLVVIPRGAVHGFVNEGDAEAKGLVVVTPGVLRPDFFREVAAVLDAAAAAGRPPDPAEIGAVMLRHGLTPAPPSA